jgi:hypothetical protein
MALRPVRIGALQWASVSVRRNARVALASSSSRQSSRWLTVVDVSCRLVEKAAHGRRLRTALRPVRIGALQWARASVRRKALVLRCGLFVTAVFALVDCRGLQLPSERITDYGDWKSSVFGLYRKIDIIKFAASLTGQR